eukprot:gene15676-18456_t
MSTELAQSTTAQVAQPIFFATLIIITAYFPLMAFENAEGKLFRPMALTVGFALAGALIYALTVAPGLAYAALKQPIHIRSSKTIERIRTHYRRALERLLDQERVTIGVIVGVMIGVIALGATIGGEFLPDMDEGSLWMQVQMPTGLSVDKASEMASDRRRTVKAFPEVADIVTQTGRNDSGTDPWSPSHIEAGVTLTPYATWPEHESKTAFVRKLSEKLAQIPGMSVGISQPIIDGVNDMVGGAHSPLVLRVYGDDFKELRRIGEDISRELKTLPGGGD